MLHQFICIRIVKNGFAADFDCNIIDKAFKNILAQVRDENSGFVMVSGFHNSALSFMHMGFQPGWSKYSTDMEVFWS